MKKANSSKSKKTAEEVKPTQLLLQNVKDACSALSVVVDAQDAEYEAARKRIQLRQAREPEKLSGPARAIFAFAIVLPTHQRKD